MQYEVGDRVRIKGGCFRSKELRFFAKGKVVRVYVLTKVQGLWEWRHKEFPISDLTTDSVVDMVKSMGKDNLSDWDLKVPPHSSRPKNKKL